MEQNSTEELKYPSTRKQLYWGIGILTAAVIVSFWLPKLITDYSWMPLKVEKTSEVGDIIGGIFGPIVGLIGVILTFLAFWIQYEANIQQRIQFNKSLTNEKTARAAEEKKNLEDQAAQNREFTIRQRQFSENQIQLIESQKLQQNHTLLQDKRARITIFESRFHSMLSIHRDNANNIEVNNIKGRKVFLHVLDELKLIFELFSAIYNTRDETDKVISGESLYNLVYLSFFFGIGEKSTPMVKDLAGENFVWFIEKSHKIIIDHIDQYEKNIDKNKKKDYIIFKINDKEYKWRNVYSFGTGHLRRLGHYVRHLFQTVKFVDDADLRLIDQQAKYNYISNLRAQLSAHEQILLFYNAISIMGQPWLSKLKGANENYIERYCMIKSIPYNAADFYKKPSDYFSDKNLSGKSMFEWIEIKERMSKL